MKERRLLLLDMATPSPWRQEKDQAKMRPATEAVWGQRYSAHRYLFDQAASARIGEMLRDCIDLMVDNIEFARPPYPTAYFEVDTRAMWSGWRPEQRFDVHGDERVGFLIHNGVVIVLAAGPIFKALPNGGLEQVHVAAKDAKICGMSFRINRPQTIPYSKLTGLDDDLADLVKTSYIFGGQRRFPDKPLGHARIDADFERGMEVVLPELPGAWTHSQIAAHFDVMPAYQVNTHKEITRLSFLGGGDPMVFVTCLLLLNQPSKYVGLTEQKREHGIWKGKRMTFKEHHVITMHLDRHEHVRRMFHTTDRASPIGHKVQGHWRHYNKSDNCNHHHPDERQAWEPVGPERTIGGDFKRYWCPLCLQRRTWLENYSTGDSSTGYATQEHIVRP